MMHPVQAMSAWSTRRTDRTVAVALAVLSYLPMLLTEPGRVSADTKTYLTLDPAAVLRAAPSMWDPSVGAGTVPHQNIGYLFPLGPFYWVMERVGFPDWLTQRILWGTLVFAASYGLYRLARWLGWRPIAALVAAFAYGFSPYLLSYLARLSVILGPWAALPWMILLTAKAARTRSWRPAAQFAIVVALVGSVNATALVLAGLGPIIWLLADVMSRRVRPTAAIAGAARIGLLSAAVSVWWIVALRIQGTYGIPILRYTETYQAVAGASTPAELIRGLGYWFFYGGDRLDTWVGPSLPYLDNPALIGLGFVIAAMGLLGFLTSFVGRASSAGLLLVGLAVSAGAAPLDRSTPYGVVFGWFAEDTTAGLALRSTPRALPLVILALALGLGSSSEWARTHVRRRVPGRFDLLVPAALVGLLAVQLFPWFTGAALTPSILRDEQLPAHETELASWLDRSDSGTDGLVYELPAADFANYRWGGTIDPVLPGLIDRPYLARELVPQGSAATADLLNAFERRLPEGWFEPEALPDFARQFGAETIVLRNQLEHERYRLARPGMLWTDVTSVLGDPDHAGPTVTDTPQIPVLDERTLAHPDAADEFPAVAAFDLGTNETLTAASSTSPLVLAGSGDGVVDLAGAGLLDGRRPLLHASTLDDLAASDRLDPAMVGPETWWVFSDTNRKQGRHWSTVSSNLGALEAAGPLSLDDDAGDNRLDVFSPTVGHQTVAVHEADVSDVRASYYGNRIAYTPEDAPWFAIDGDPATAWRAGVFDTTSGLVWEVELVEPVEASTVTLLQPITGATNRFVTEVRVTLDDDASFIVGLDETSRTAPGQTIDLPDGTFGSLRLEILADNVGELSSYGAQPGVGFAEVVIPGVRDDRVVQLPGTSDFEHLEPDVLDTQRLTYLLTRERIDPATSNRTSPEQHLVRRFEVPDTRTFDLVGEVRLAADASEATLGEVLGDEVTVIADRRLSGSPASRGASAFDGDLRTSWVTPFDDVVGDTLTLPEAVTANDGGGIDAVTLWWLDDGEHSLPTELVVASADGATAVVSIPPTAPIDGLATVTVALTATLSSPITMVTLLAIDQRTTPEYFSGFPQVLPVGIAELQFVTPTDSPTKAAATLDPTCRSDLLLVDGQPFAVRIIGTRADALARNELTLQGCEPLVLEAGSHRLDAAPGAVTGFDLDRLVVDSAGARSPTTTAGADVAPRVDVDRRDTARMELTIGEAGEPAWLILRQSWNAGWTATLDGTDLGEPVLIEGFANGWLLPASGGDRQVTLEWTPQRSMRLALWFSLVAGLVVIGLALSPRRRGVARLDADPGRWAPPNRSRRWRTAGAIGLVAATAFLAGPLPAVSGLVIWAVGRHRRWVPAVLVVASVVGSGAVVLLLEWRYDFAADPDWPSRFSWASPVVWLGVTTAVFVAVLPERQRCEGPPH